MRLVTVALLFSLLLQATAVVLLIVTLRRGYWHHLGAMFVTAAVVYHGVAEVANRVGPGGLERQFLPAKALDDWMLIVGPAILLFTLAYLCTLGRSRLCEASDDTEGLARTRAFFQWKTIALIVAPMYLVSLTGRLSGSIGGLTTANYLQSGLVSQFLLIGVVLLGYAIVAQYGPRIAMKVLVAQSLALILLGERLTVVAAGLMLLYSLTRLGLRTTRRQIAVLVIVGAASALVISGARATGGRQQFAHGSGASSRIAGAATGIKALVTGHVSGGFAEQYSRRLDGNNFAAWVVSQSGSGGQSAMGFQTLANDVWLAIPSIVLHHKLSADLATRSEEFAIETHFQMPPTNRLPTTLGTLEAYEGGHWLLALAMILGAVFGLADRWLKRATPARLIVGVCLVSAIAFYESSPSVYPLELRGGLLLIVLIRIIQFFRDAAGGRWLGVAPPAPVDRQRSQMAV